jgi:hypothetical protein
MDNADQGYELSFEERSDYLYAHVRAEHVMVETVIEYLNKMADKCGELGYNRLMIDRDVPVTLSTVDMFAAVADITPRMVGRRTVLIDRDAEHQAAWDFARMVSNNRGGQFAVMTSVPEGEAWLLKD